MQEAIFSCIADAVHHNQVSADAAVARLRALLHSFDVVRKGMACGGRDSGTRPIHLVLVARACTAIARQVLSLGGAVSETPARRLAELMVAAAHDHLLSFQAARRLVLELVGGGALGGGGAAAHWQRVVEPPTGPEVGKTSGGRDGFCAHCSEPSRRLELRRLARELLARGVAVSTEGLPTEALLREAEREAASMRAAGELHASVVKAGGNARRYEDASTRGDVVRWMDGTDGRAPACAALAQWLRGELMDEIRDACAAAPPGTNGGAGGAPTLKLEPPSALPLAMLACYPGGGTRFLRHVDNSPESPDTRAVTAIVYLNSSWSPADGGELRIYDAPTADDAAASAAAARGTVASLVPPPPPPGGAETPAAVRVEPRLGTLVLFWSHRVPHEVMPASTPRFAMSLWMCVAPDQPPGWLQQRPWRAGAAGAAGAPAPARCVN